MSVTGLDALDCLDREVIWKPQDGPQRAAILCPHKEILYGGAAGGGKSDWLLGEIAYGIEPYGENWKCILVRRTYQQLEELESRSLQIFGPHYGINNYKRGTKTWYFHSRDNGVAELRLRAIESRQDVLKFQGHQFSLVGIDELTQFPDDFILEYLLTRLRSPGGAPTYVRLTANPGGVGHHWVKSRFKIGDVDPMKPIDVETPSGIPYKRVFIPALLEDNKILMKNDPAYQDNLARIADPMLRRALRRGDWNIAQGAAFPEFNPDVHVVPPFVIPDDARVWFAMDWGSDKPYAGLWFYADFDGNVYIINELYGCGVKPNTGVNHSPEMVSKLIKEVEKSYRWDVRERFLDPQCWAQHGGPTIFEMLGGYKMGWKPWPKGKDSRINQKQMVHEYLRVINGYSRLRIFGNGRCDNLIRILSTIPRDPGDTSDVDTHSEDHLYDTLRGGLCRTVATREQNMRRNELAWLVDQDQKRETGQFGGW